jgi:putative ABC transport system ATP-binding protein
MLSTHKLHFSYPKGPAFDFPYITLADQKHLLILGKSGVRKTTLLHLLGLLLRLNSGSITINGKELSVLGERQKGFVPR